MKIFSQRIFSTVPASGVTGARPDRTALPAFGAVADRLQRVAKTG